MVCYKELGPDCKIDLPVSLSGFVLGFAASKLGDRIEADILNWA